MTWIRRPPARSRPRPREPPSPRRGRNRIGSTLVKVLEWYSGQIRDAGGRLYLSGVDPRVAEQIQRSGLIGPEDLTVVEATEILGESTHTATTAGTTWLREGTSPDA
jgi:SulP family sulfate permease